MKWTLDIDIKQPSKKIMYPDRIMLIGSCFTEHIGRHLQLLKFPVVQNPNGILFDPLSVCSSLISYTRDELYSEDILVQQNELWQSWHHHSRFSGTDKSHVLGLINAARSEAHDFLSKTKWLIITLGSAFAYRLQESGAFVANCHKAPAQLFSKHLCTIEEINSALDNCLYQLFRFNPGLQVILTVSPVRHIRDGVINNNRSKARLLEGVHHICEKFDQLHYFPSYELVIDVLRDYRFYDIDLVHPNYQATQYVVQQFVTNYFTDESRLLAAEMEKIANARKHKPFHESSNAHAKFRQTFLEKVKQISAQYPFLPLEEELEFFSGQL
ncbi:MAG TPA: GSCFA domain-containing protein [Flavitalea sp.]|nr:GSCFA domain-containing protein [Flavitalea sp.]